MPTLHVLTLPLLRPVTHYSMNAYETLYGMQWDSDSEEDKQYEEEEDDD